MSEPHQVSEPEPNPLSLYRENQRLRAMIAHMKDGGCHAAHPGEITYECSLHIPGGKCWACRARAAMEPETDNDSLRRAIRLVIDAAETLSSAAGYEPDGEGGMDHRGMCQQELDAVERVKRWLGPRPITPELRD